MIRVRSGIASHILGLGLDCFEGNGLPVSLLHRSDVVGKTVDIGPALKPFTQFTGHSVGQRRVAVQADAIGSVCIGHYPLLAGTNTSEPDLDLWLVYPALLRLQRCYRPFIEGEPKAIGYDIKVLCQDAVYDRLIIGGQSSASRIKCLSRMRFMPFAGSKGHRFARGGHRPLRLSLKLAARRYCKQRRVGARATRGSGDSRRKWRLG